VLVKYGVRTGWDGHGDQKRGYEVCEGAVVEIASFSWPGQGARVSIKRGERVVERRLWRHLFRSAGGLDAKEIAQSA
jgi:hypothetical protein